MYYGAVETLAQRVTRYIRRHKLLNPGDRVGVAVSGGADSVALLRLLLELRDELGVVLSVVHFNHKLRGKASDGDEGRYCAPVVGSAARRFTEIFAGEEADLARRRDESGHSEAARADEEEAP